MDISKIRSKRRCTLYPSNPLMSKKKAASDKQAIEVIRHFEPAIETSRNSDQSEELPYFAPEEDDDKEVVEGIKFQLSHNKPDDSVSVQFEKEEEKRSSVQSQNKQVSSGAKKTSIDKKHYPSKPRPKRPTSHASSTSNQSKKSEQSRKLRPAKHIVTNKANNAYQSVGKNRYIDVTDNTSDNFSIPQDQKPYSVVTASYIENLKDEIRTIASKNNDHLTKTANELRNEISQFRKSVKTKVKVSVKNDKNMPPIMKVQITRPEEYSPPPGGCPQNTTCRSAQCRNTTDNAINTDTVNNSNNKPPYEVKSTKAALTDSVVPERKDRIRSCIKKYDLEAVGSAENDNYSKISEQINNVNYDISTIKSSDSDSVDILYATRMDLQSFDDDYPSEDESIENLQCDDADANSSASNKTEEDFSDNDDEPPSIIPVLMQAIPNPLDIRCSEDTRPKESCSACVLVENEAHLRALDEKNEDIETFAKLLAEAQFVLQNITKKVKNISPRDCDCQGKTIDARINNDELLSLECSKPLSEGKLVDKALSACTTNVSKVSVGVQATSTQNENGDKQNVVIKIPLPLVDQPCSALSLDVLHCDKLCSAQNLYKNDDVCTILSDKYELASITSISTGISSISEGKVRGNDVSITAASLQDVASLKDADKSSISDKLSKLENEEISEEVKILKNMDTIIELSEKDNSDDSNMKTQCTSRESCARSKLTIQIMPSIDIRRGLVTQKIPNIVITANESMPDTETDQKSNVAYEVVKHMCCTENCKLELQSEGKENVQDGEGVNIDNIEENSKLNLLPVCNNSKKSYCLSTKEIDETNEPKDDVQKQVLLVIPEKDSCKPEQADTDNKFISVGVQTSIIDDRAWSETSSLPSYDYQFKRFVQHSSPQLELPQHNVAVRKYINCSYEEDTNSEQEVFAPQSHKSQKASSIKIPNAAEHLAPHPSERSTKTYVKHMMEKGPEAENIMKSFQLLEEKLSHNPENELDERALSTIDMDVYKTYVNPKGLEHKGTNIAETEKLNATTSYSGERLSICSFLKFKSADRPHYHKRMTTEKVNAATSHHNPEKGNSILLKFKDKGVNTIATEKLHAATSFSSSEKQSISSKAIDYLEDKEVNTTEVEKLVAVTSPYSFKRQSSSSLQLKHMNQLENKEVNTEEITKLNASSSYNNTETSSALQVSDIDLFKNQQMMMMEIEKLNDIISNQNSEELSSESLKLQGTYQLENIIEKDNFSAVPSPKNQSSNHSILVNQFDGLPPLNTNENISSHPMDKKQESSRFIVHDYQTNGEYSSLKAGFTISKPSSTTEPHGAYKTQEQATMLSQPPVNNLAPKTLIVNNVIQEDQITSDSMTTSASVNLKIEADDLESSSQQLIFKALPTIFAEQSTTNIASNFLNPNSCETLSQSSNNTDDIICEIKSSQLRSYSKNLMRSRNTIIKQSLTPTNEDTDNQIQMLAVSKDSKKTSVSESNSLDTSSDSFGEYIITHDVAIQTSLSNFDVKSDVHEFSAKSLKENVDSLKEIVENDVLNEEEVTSSCCKRLLWNGKKKESKNTNTKFNFQEHPNTATRTSVLRLNAGYDTSKATLVPSVNSSFELTQQKSVKIEEPLQAYSNSISHYNQTNKEHKEDFRNNKANRNSVSSTDSSNNSKLDKIIVMTVNIKQPKVFAGQRPNEFINQGHSLSGDGGDCVEPTIKKDENIHKKKSYFSPVLSKYKDDFYQQKDKSEVTDKATSGASSSEATASDSDSLKRKELLSDGELKCKCSASIGEIHRCSKKNFKSKIPYLKRHPQELLAREFGNPNLKIKRKTQFYSNWVAYYISKNDHSDSDNTDSQNTKTDSSGQVKK